MGKGKLQKFAEVESFGNVLQPSFEEVMSGFPIKGRWAEEVFRNSNPITLELACGKAEYTIALAERHPERNFIGIDIKGSRMWRGAKTAIERNLSNVAFLRIQIDQIERCFAWNEISEIWITFPDPHPRKSRARRRLTSPVFLNKFRNILKPEGIIHFKTDNEVLFNYTLEIIKEHNHQLLEHYRDVYKSETPEEVHAIQTFYEQMFLSQGLPIFYLKFKLALQQ